MESRMKTFQEYLTEEMVSFSAFYLSRVSMPQISNINRFEKWLDSTKIESELMVVKTKLLNPTQSDYDQEKVDKIIATKLTDAIQRKPIIVDESFYILDGHHRFFANDQSGENETWVLKVELPINKLLKTAYHYKELYNDG